MYRTFYFKVILWFFCFNLNAQIEINKTITTDSLFRESQLLKHIKALSSDAFEGRRTGTQGAIKARKYIINQFHALGVLPLKGSYEQDFTFSNSGKFYKGTNVLGIINGTEFSNKYIVISAHYDHEGIKRGQIYNGADDDASGISALFSFAEYLSKYPPKYSVILAAFDAEELGLQGSKYFVNHPKVTLSDIKVNLNMDMISRSDKNELFAVGTIHHNFLKQVILKSQDSKKIKLLIGHDDGSWKDNWTFASDHANFHEKNIPFIYFGVDDHEDYHEPTDDFENIHPKFYIEAVKVIIEVFQKIDQLKL